MKMSSHIAGEAASATQSHRAELLYRVGFSCHGFVHLVIGCLALSLALGEGGALIGPKGALGTIGRQPFGAFMLLILGLGMLGYVAWRFAQAFGNLDHERPSGKSVVKRIGQAASGFIYLSFAWLALRAVFTGAVVKDNESSLSAKVLDLPGGSYILIAIGIVVAVTGLQQIAAGIRERFMTEVDQRAMSARESAVLRMAGKFGLPARGVVLGIIGYLLAKTGWHHRPRNTGTKGALETLMGEPYGTTVLALIAIGFIAYAVYCFIASRYRHFVR
jgi:hypothetical protein